MRKALSLSFIVTMVALAAYFSKPSEEECLAKAKQEFVAKKLSYTAQTLPAGVNRSVFQKTAEKNFEASIQVEDKAFYQSIVQMEGGKKTNIGYGIFGWIKIDLP